jgi:hypothetical protein
MSYWEDVYLLQQRNHQEQAAQARFELETAQSRDDTVAGADAAARLLQIENSWAAFHDGAVRHAASLAGPPPEDPRAWMDKPAERLSDNDAFLMVNQTSKYCDPRQGGTPISADEYRRHMQERDRRVQSGHYQGGRVGR